MDYSEKVAAIGLLGLSILVFLLLLQARSCAIESGQQRKVCEKAGGAILQGHCYLGIKEIKP